MPASGIQFLTLKLLYTLVPMILSFVNWANRNLKSSNNSSFSIPILMLLTSALLTRKKVGALMNNSKTQNVVPKINLLTDFAKIG